MPFQKKTVKHPKNSMSLTLGLVQAAMDENLEAITQAQLALSKSSAIDIFADLGDFYSRISSGITAESKEIMRIEIAAVEGPEELRTAVREIATPLIVDNDGHAAVAAINRHGAELITRTDNLWFGVIMETVFAAARINVLLGIRLNWN
jgi:hypothetical protein